MSEDFRKEAYKCITDAVDRIVSEGTSNADLARPSVTVRRDLIVNAVLRSKDELANVAMFKWLLDNDLSSVLLQVLFYKRFFNETGCC